MRRGARIVSLPPRSPPVWKARPILPACCHWSSGRSRRSSFSSILRRLCACLVFCPARLRRMKSSVLSTCSFCRSYSARARSIRDVALDDVLVVAERVADELAVLELDDLAADRADEGAIVRHQHERARVLGEVRLEPLDRGQIEVVRRLVHQQEIGLAHQHLGQLEPAALAARQRVDAARRGRSRRTRRRRSGV